MRTAFPALVGYVAKVDGVWHPCEAPFSAVIRLLSTPATDDDEVTARAVPRDGVAEVRALATTATWHGASVTVSSHQRAGVVLRMWHAPEGTHTRPSTTGGRLAVVDPAELADVVTVARLVQRRRPRWARADDEDPSLLASSLYAEADGRWLRADEALEGLVPVGRDPLADVPVAQTLLGFTDIGRFVRASTSAVLDGAPVQVTAASGVDALVRTGDGVERRVPLASLVDIVEEVRPATVAPPPVHKPAGLLPPPRLSVRPDPVVAAWVERTGPEHRYLRHLVVTVHNELWNRPDERAQLAALLAAAETAGPLDPTDDIARAVLHLDWAVRRALPTWLVLAGLTEDADRLRAAPAVTDATSVEAVRPLLTPRRLAAAAAARQIRPDTFRIETVVADLAHRGAAGVVSSVPPGDAADPRTTPPFPTAAVSAVVRECVQVVVHQWYAELVAAAAAGHRPPPGQAELEAVAAEVAGPTLDELRHSAVDLVRRALDPRPHP